MTGALVISIATASGAASVSAESANSRAQTLTATRVLLPSKCHAHKGLRFYTRRYNEHRAKMGQDGRAIARHLPDCPRYLASLMRRKAFAARKAYERWFAYHWNWQAWLPDKWQRIGACETGYGRRPGNWRHSNSSYEGAFGFAKSSWDAFKGRADRKAGPYPEDAWQATPRQQYEVALAIYRMYGFSGWGCRGA